MPGALARKRCDPAKKGTVKYVTFGPKVAPFPSERRVSSPDPPPLSGKWGTEPRPARQFTWDLHHQLLDLPTLSEMWGVGSRPARQFT